jgi:cobalt-precorrin 5A hydrolase/precorrin-3B C17-methyltransferase
VTSAPVFVVLTAKGLTLARRLAAGLGGAQVHGLTGRADGADRTFARAAVHLGELYGAGRPIVGVCSSGVLIRALAPLVIDKGAEPPVVAVAEDGSTVVPLLGGHRGANALAERLAGVLGVPAAVTTASDRRFAIALDQPPPGLRLANPEHHKAFAAELLAGAKPRLVGDAPWLASSRLPFDEAGALTVRVTDQAVEGAPDELVYHPTRLAVGLGCERGCSARELLDLVRETLRENGLAARSVAGVFSIDLKSDEPAIHAVAAHLGAPARFFDAETLDAQAPRLATPSEEVRRAVGVPGVAEAAALAAAGPEGALIVTKRKSKRATCAVARAPEALDAATLGRPRGRLAVVGLGPGCAPWRTPEAEAALARATDLVGYRLYLDLAGPLALGQTRHDFDLGEEEVRVRLALDLAAQGRDVALVSSGDPGIYAMASLVFELLDRGEVDGWRRVEIEVVPGLSALQATAARIGAPLGHDFCAISLSDLLTPWATIERRVRAAAEGDFVIAFYNPVSSRRRRQLEKAVEILLAHRPADTPVVLGQNLGREGESVSSVRLGDLSADRVDMLTLVLVGSSQTRSVERRHGVPWVYTPRGYSAEAAG